MKNFENWDWEKEDPAFYRDFHRLPESKDKVYRETVKRRRYQQQMRNFRIDLRPSVFLRVMSKELLLIGFGVFFGLSLPFYFKYVNRLSRRPTDAELTRMREDLAASSPNHADTFRLPASPSAAGLPSASFVINQSPQQGPRPHAIATDD